MLKKFLLLSVCICLLLSTVLVLSSCGGEADIEPTETAGADGEPIDIDITEATYKGWIKELETNAPSYVGQRIRLEGIKYSYKSEKNGNTYNTVYRDGCCANDHMYYLEFVTGGSVDAENGDWVEVIGTFNEYQEGDQTYYNLKDASVVVKTERGTEMLGL